MTVDLLAIDHVQLLMPPGASAEDEARRFYGAVLGLEEVAKPAALAERGGLWFRRGPVSLHLGVDPTFAPARRSHPAFVVADLAAARSRLAAGAVTAIEDDSALPVDRVYVEDPFGNRIELVDAADADFTDPARRRR